MAYQTENEISKVVRSFEDGTISRSNWRHAEHLTVACYYAFHFSIEEAADKMRAGIFNLLKAFDVDLALEMPYHETLTIFWMRTIFDFIKTRKSDSLLETINRVLEICADKDLPLKFYSRDFLFSDEARKNFVEGDLR